MIQGRQKEETKEKIIEIINKGKIRYTEEKKQKKERMYLRMKENLYFQKFVRRMFSKATSFFFFNFLFFLYYCLFLSLSFSFLNILLFHSFILYTLSFCLFIICQILSLFSPFFYSLLTVFLPMYFNPSSQLFSFLLWLFSFIPYLSHIFFLSFFNSSFTVAKK